MPQVLPHGSARCKGVLRSGSLFICVLHRSQWHLSGYLLQPACYFRYIRNVVLLLEGPAII